MTPDQIRQVVDAVFEALEAATVGRPLIHMGVVFAHHLVDDVVLRKVAAKLAAAGK